jgi:hypothetical protein
MFISVLGSTINYGGLAVIAILDLNINYCYVFSLIGGCTGGFSLFLMALFSAFVLCHPDTLC